MAMRLLVAWCAGMASAVASEPCVGGSCLADDDTALIQKPRSLNMLTTEKRRASDQARKGASYHAFISSTESRSTFIMDISSLKDKTYAFTVTSFSPAGEILELYKGAMPNFAIDPSTQKFSSDVVFTGLPWKGKMSGEKWQGEITMDSGFKYDIIVSVAEGGGRLKHQAQALTKKEQSLEKEIAARGNAVYLGQVSKRGTNERMFSMVVSKRQGATYNFVSSCFECSSGTEQYAGSIKDFVYNKADRSFSGDVSFQNFPWTGSVKGSNWEGTIEMASGDVYDLSLFPLTGSGEKTDAPVKAAYIANIHSGHPSKTTFTMAISPLSGTTYSFTTSDFAGKQLDSGKFTNWMFDSTSQSFSADVEFAGRSWIGKLKGQDWTGAIEMENGYSYSIETMLPEDAPKAGSLNSAYYGAAKATGMGTAAFGIALSPVSCGSDGPCTYGFAMSGFALDGTTQHFGGEFQNFAFDKTDESFSGDVVFANLPWTGKLQGKKWKGSILMGNGWKYDVAFTPCKKAA